MKAGNSMSKHSKPENPNKVNTKSYTGRDGKVTNYPEADMPEIYLVAGGQALWMTSPTPSGLADVPDWPEMFWYAPLVIAKSDFGNSPEGHPQSHIPGAIPDMSASNLIANIENWEGTCWYNPDLDVWGPNQPEMDQIEADIRAFHAFAMKWNVPTQN